MARILLVEDDEALGTALELRFAAEGFSVQRAASAREAWEALPEADLVILDWMLPDEPGIRLLERIRQSPHAELPVLVLTAKAREADRVEGFLRGADDYLTKPFSTDELVLRVRALLRRARRSRLSLGELELDPDAAEVRLKGRPVPLSPREYALLLFFARHPGRVYSREELLERVWGPDYQGTARTVDQHVAQLREKLGPGWIETVRGVGYRFRGGDLG